MALTLELLLAELASIAATGFCVGCADVNRDRACAETCNLLLCCWANVVGENLRAQSPCSRDCLEAGNTGTDDHAFSRWDCSRSRDGHWEKTWELFGSDDCSPVPCNGRHRAENVHRLGTARAWNLLERQNADASRKEFGNRFGIFPTLRKRDERLPVADLASNCSGERQRAEDFCMGKESIAIENRCTCMCVELIGESRPVLLRQIR